MPESQVTFDKHKETPDYVREMHDFCRSLVGGTLCNDSGEPVSRITEPFMRNGCVWLRHRELSPIKNNATTSAKGKGKS